MPIPPKLKSIYKRLRWVDKTFIILLVVYLALLPFPYTGWTALAGFLTFVFGVVEAIRLTRAGMRKAIWRLRNRLIVTYLFIAVVPVVLVFTLAAVSLWALISQVAVYLVSSELDRRIDSLTAVSDSVLRTDTNSRPDVMRRLAELMYKDRFPGIQMILRREGRIERYPADGTAVPPSRTWGNESGLVRRQKDVYAWSHVKLADGDFTVLAPMSRKYLSNLVPGLGRVQLTELVPGQEPQGLKSDKPDLSGTDPETPLPPKSNRFDIQLGWAAIFRIADWQAPGKETNVSLYVMSRPSAVYNSLFSRKADSILQGILPILLIVVSIAFLIVELFSLVIGISMTRTITSAVHHLYEGTQRVMRGDFSHRITVQGNDQLGELSKSFNQMTARVEELLVVAKEKERLQSELEIAREVQNQLYPKKVPDVRTLRLTAVCKPARMVSGDYFDYECMHGSKVALAIGDVAGKGISAALLMATLQSSLRTELRGSMTAAAAAGNGSAAKAFSTAELVGHLNEQLYAYTSPEKYATFYLAIYDEETGLLTYTNAGHLPPVLVRDGEATRLNVDGTVVGAFPFAQFDESRVDLKAGDLLVCFTDGVSEPENEYGEMFGEERLIDMVIRNAHRSEDQIVAAVIEAVEQWTGSPELQDDMTLLLARRQ